LIFEWLSAVESEKCFPVAVLLRADGPAAASNCRVAGYRIERVRITLLRTRNHNAEPFGIIKRYKDALGNWLQTPQDTYATLLEAMGQREEKKEAPILVVRCGQRKRLKAPAEIILEDGGTLKIRTTLPGDLPLGYHTLRYLDGDRIIRLIVSPGVCFLPKDLGVWAGRHKFMPCALLIVGA
jgi:hypothetical protein